MERVLTSRPLIYLRTETFHLQSNQLSESCRSVGAEGGFEPPFSRVDELYLFSNRSP